jgi:hypothetical protein
MSDTQIGFLCEEINKLAEDNQRLLTALEATLPALIRLGDFVGNVDTGGASGLGTIDRCAIIHQVRDAIDKSRG